MVYYESVCECVLRVRVCVCAVDVGVWVGLVVGRLVCRTDTERDCQVIPSAKYFLLMM